MRRILAIFLIIITCSVSFASVSKSLEFPLILHKQGRTDLYFSLTEDGSSRETSIDNLVSTNNQDFLESGRECFHFPFILGNREE